MTDPAPSLPVNRDGEAAPPEHRRMTIAEMLHARKHRVDGWTPGRVGLFIEALAETGSVTRAAHYAEISPSSAYQLRNHPDAGAFREAWDCAVSQRFAALSDIAYDRIREGVEKKRWWQDQVVGHDRVFSDRLLIHMLTLCDPDRRAAAGAAASAPAAPAPRAAAIDEAFAATPMIPWSETRSFDPPEREYDADTMACMAERRARWAAERAESEAFTASFDAMKAKHFPAPDVSASIVETPRRRSRAHRRATP